MPVTNEEARALGKRIVAARGRILVENGFYGLLLSHMRFALDDAFDTAWVDTHDTISFHPSFVGKLNAEELAYVVIHETMHAALSHLQRQGERDQALWNLAADIVVNSNIKHSMGDDPASITLRCQGGESFHLTPDGEEGWLYSVEEVYEMLVQKQKKGSPSSAPGTKPSEKNRRSGSGCGCGQSSEGGKEGVASTSRCPGGSGNAAIDAARAVGRGGRWDWHIVDDGSDPAKAAEMRDVWAQRLADAAEAMSVRDPSNSRGLVPACAVRRLDELRGAMADWRILLNDFVQQEICDFTFFLPDRRFAESPYILPGFNDTEATIHDVLFMVDASGSVSDAELTAAFSEVKGALDQFNGKLDGWVGFFDSIPYEPIRFETAAELLSSHPKGGGGTRYEAVFECVNRWLGVEDLVCIVVLTDGYAPAPDESLAKGVPVLWLIVGDGPAPSWGKVARIAKRWQ